MTSDDALDFLRRLDEADFSVTAWEADFLESCLDRAVLTDKQIEVVERMAEKYEGRL